MKLPILFLFTLVAPVLAGLPVTFPQESWERPDPVVLGLDREKMKLYGTRMGGDGCIVKDGYMIHEWGNIRRQHNWESASKPVLSTMLMLAVAQKRIPRVDYPVAKLGWALRPKDQGMTLLHLANMTSGYVRVEKPGEAWAYNDYGIQLLAKSLERLYDVPLNDAALAALAPLKFQDGKVFGPTEKLAALLSARDMARLGWLWLNKGRWGEQEIIPQELFTKQVRMQVAGDLPRSKKVGEDYLGIDTYGGGHDQTEYGPGVYGFCFWFNGQLPSGERFWPGLPLDTYQSNGMWNRNTVTMIPSLNLVVVVSSATSAGRFNPGKEDVPMVRNLKLLVDSFPAAKTKGKK